jgi:hypothetical protein
MIDLAELGLKIRSDGVVVAENRLDRMTAASGRATTASGRLIKANQQMGRILTRVGFIAGTAMAGVAANSVRLAVAAEETANKFSVVFRGSIEESNAELIEMTNTIPLTVTQMRAMAAGIQDMLVPMGVARAEAAGMSVDMIKLAGDMASFNNVGTDTVLMAVQSALAGSSEPMRRYGVDTRETRLQTLALTEGIIRQGKELDNATRAQTVLLAIQRDSTDAMGDAARTVDSTANRMRFFSRDVKQAQEDLGQALIPALGQLLTTLNDVDENGISPLQRSLISISRLILNTTKGVLMGISGWKLLTNAFQDVQDELSDLVNLAETFSATLPGWLGGEDSSLGALKDQLAPTVKQLRELREEARALRDAELEKSLDGMFEVIAGLDEALASLGTGVDRSLKDTNKALDDTGEAITQVAEAWEAFFETAEDAADWWDKIRRDVDPAAAALEDFTDAQSRLDALLKSGKISGKQYGDAVHFLAKQTRDAALASIELDEAIETVHDIIADMVKELGIENAALLIAIERTEDLELAKLRLAGATDAEIDAIKRLRAENDGLGDQYNSLIAQSMTLGESMMAFGQIAGTAISGIQSAVDEGSDAYRNLQFMIDAANVVAAVGAVLNQAQGDPYTAWARMAAMAGVVASLGYAVGNIAGSQSGFDDTAANRQALQGTGTVFGDLEAKSESIIKATEITADATSELVGINRGMLHALLSLTDAITGASNILSRDATSGQFAGLPSTFQPSSLIPSMGDFLNDVWGGILDSIFGGSAKVTDEGIAILGGTIGELIDGTLIKAYQTVQYRKWRFGSKKTREDLIDLGGDAASQFGLVFQALVDVVSEGALALGLPLDVIEQRIAMFRVAEQEISLMGLNAEEQAAEIQAVISSIFDDLASSVIPFIDQFQQAGEGMGETLIRVATSVQVFDEAVQQLGFAADHSNPEQLAQMAVGLVDLAGGVSEFIAQFTGFMDKFASDEQKLAFVTDQITRAFEQAGLALPETRDGVWDLIQSLDAATESGREGIATLLRLGPALDQYYDLMEARAKQATDELIRAFFGTGLDVGFATLVAERDRTATMRAADLRDRIHEVLVGFDGSAEQLELLSSLTQDRYKAEIDMLLEIEAVTANVTNLLGSLREMIIGDLSTPEQNYERARREAERLAESLLTMTDPAQINATVARIEQLTRGAYGLLDEDQRAAMGQEFLDFIDEVERIALSRLSEAQERAIAEAAELRDMVSSVVEQFGTAAEMLIDAAESLKQITRPGPVEGGPLDAYVTPVGEGGYPYPGEGGGPVFVIPGPVQFRPESTDTEALGTKISEAITAAMGDSSNDAVRAIREGMAGVQIQVTVNAPPSPQVNE